MSSSTRLSLRFEYPPQSYHSDIRTFKIIGFEEGHEDTTELYKVSDTVSEFFPSPNQSSLV